MYAKPELTLVGNATGVVLGEPFLPELENKNSTIFDTYIPE